MGIYVLRSKQKRQRKNVKRAIAKERFGLDALQDVWVKPLRKRAKFIDPCPVVSWQKGKPIPF